MPLWRKLRTAFFVEADNSSKSNEEPENDFDRLDLELLAIGKKAGLSFAEINMFRVSDLIKYVKIYTGNDEQQAKHATQADFDSF